tara:strand:+ start:14 stop:505 length:492 start_codon:yes stop_codon:yes gene_type:complete
MSDTLINEELPRIQIQTLKGQINIELFEEDAPNTVGNMISLIEKDFYNGLVFHRVIPNFMIQGGCPLGTGTGDPGYKFDDEFMPNRNHDGPGILSMANAGPGTNGSQFFITHSAQPHLDGKHTVFGKVIDGQEVVNTIQKGDVMEKVVVLQKRDHLYEVKTLL